MAFTATLWPPLRYSSVSASTRVSAIANAANLNFKPFALPAPAAQKTATAPFANAQVSTTYLSATRTAVGVLNTFAITDRRLTPAASTLQPNDANASNVTVLAPPV